jgi:type III restriction enzyme
MSEQASLFADNQKYLFEELKEKAFDLGIAKPEIPNYLAANLKHDFWRWQSEALKNFLTFEKIKEKEKTNEPTHLMFNMATGTGKTMLMAALILYYYKKGYKHFIFFVSQNNIIDKTENNFINKYHTKYLFRQNIVIDDKIINIRKVATFDDADDIQIKFTSIHKLHNAVYSVKENSVTLEDLQKRDLVMIGDEAHHFNAATKNIKQQAELDFNKELKDNASPQDIEKSWENTVINKILKRGQDRQETENRNVLLEFTATIPKDIAVQEKYRGKIIYQFKLVDFFNAGYTKEINIISTSLKKKEKILLALAFNWYRSKIALKNGILNFKPVILFRSKYIEESKKDYEEFRKIIDNLQSEDFDFLQTIEKSIRHYQPKLEIYEQGESRIRQMSQFIEDEKIKNRDIVKFIQYEFAEKNCIITNSKDNKATTKEKTTQEQEQLLNSLEDKNNNIRAIFTVKRLTEGWDVLNLFDIVRLYEERDEGHPNGQRVAGQATVQEIQLIGRGVRYFPFDYNEREKNKRKFDNDLANPMRILEEFYFHSSGKDAQKERRYIDELKRELKNRGLIADNRKIKKFALKDEFKNTQFFKEIKIWQNERIDNPNKRKKNLDDLKRDPEINPFPCKTRAFALKEQHVDLNKDKDEILAETANNDEKTIFKKFSEFEKHIILKAINKKAQNDLSLLRFDNLRQELDINSIDDFIKNFIGDFEIKITTSNEKINLDNISNEEKLEWLLDFFEKFTQKLKEIANPYKGTEKFKPFSFEELFGEPKEKSIDINKYDQSLVDEFRKHKWFVLDNFTCTSEERELLEFIKNRIGNLEKKYEEVYLLRNEEVYKIYDFEKGRGFEPDFLLFLKGKKSNLYYQIFIEPKGEQYQDAENKFLKSKEGWKEEFLQQITNKYGNSALLKAESKDYKLIGLPLYNNTIEAEFEKSFSKQLLR